MSCTQGVSSPANASPRHSRNRRAEQPRRLGVVPGVAGVRHEPAEPVEIHRLLVNDQHLAVAAQKGPDTGRNPGLAPVADHMPGAIP
jgi:hypothetical protein